MKVGLFGGPVVTGGGAATSQAQSAAWFRYVDKIVEAEELGFYSVFLTEHHFSGLGQVPTPLTLLSYVAACTETIRLGTAVTVLPWHNPLLLVEQANAVDLLSKGRLDLGIGRGYRQSEFDAFGIDAATAGERYDEALEVIRTAWSGPEAWSHDGPLWRFESVCVEPTPVQAPHPPIWVASGSEVGIRSAARNGFNLLLDQFAPFEEIATRVDWYRQEVKAQRGEEDIAGRIAVTRPLIMADTRAERDSALALRTEMAQATAARSGGSNPGASRSTFAQAVSRENGQNTEAGGIIGPPQECVERLQRLAESGVDYVLLVEQQDGDLRRFADQVMPNLRVLDGV